MLSYKVDHDSLKGIWVFLLAPDPQFLRNVLRLNNQCVEWLKSHYRVRVKINCIGETKHEYYKIRDVPHNASFSDSDYDVMDEDKISFDEDSYEERDLDIDGFF